MKWLRAAIYFRAKLSDAPVARDVVVAALGAAAGIAGLVLVFLGVSIAAYQSLGPASSRVRRPYQAAIRVSTGSFGLSLLSVVASFAWLLAGGPKQLYAWVVGLFLLQLAILFAVALYSVRTLVR